ncbi:MAG: symmetrical bis(5'-nucleosyl)-tetraphosphatase [Betaproteobacteria bacterium]|nr:MAG: symmetrical bis(5'-nucleosyl)-tetraphosphatase [Betaproteobacteria bacterium]
MATYAVGDIQGCLQPFQQLLDVVGFNQQRDRLWLVGDLVNRGPDSLQTLRYVRGLGNAAITVLGNHDLHLLTVAAGFARIHKTDTLEDILGAADRVELLDWLRARKLFHHEEEYAMVHAGLLPQWSIERAAELAAEVEQVLQSPRHIELVQHMYGGQPDQWQDTLEGWDRLRVIINAMTRMRLCTIDGKMEFHHKGEPTNLPQGYMPWFEVPGRCSASATVICGHWSALGLRIEPKLLAIDGGCLWGRQLCAVRLEDRQLFQINCPAQAA